MCQNVKGILVRDTKKKCLEHTRKCLLPKAFKERMCTCSIESFVFVLV